MATTITDEVRLALRITTTALDDELDLIINAGKNDLKHVGLTEEAIVDTDPSIVTALILYAKAQEDFDGKGDKYKVAYEALRNGLSMNGDYNV